MPLSGHHAESCALVDSLGRIPFSKAIKRKMERQGRLVSVRSFAGKPHALHVAVALAFEHGLDEPNLRHVLNSYETRNKKGEHLFEGSLSQVLNSVRTNLLEKVHNLLHEKPQALDSRQIASALNVSADARTLEKITAALGVLDLMGLTRKLPGSYYGRQLGYKWAHACHQQRECTIPEWNLDWRILQQATKSQVKVADFAKEKELLGKRTGSPEGLATARAVKDAFKRLEKAKLLEIKKLREGWTAVLSAKGTGIMKEQAQLSFLHDGLRKLILG